MRLETWFKLQTLILLWIFHLRAHTLTLTSVWAAPNDRISIRCDKSLENELQSVWKKKLELVKHDNLNSKNCFLRRTYQPFDNFSVEGKKLTQKQCKILFLFYFWKMLLHAEQNNNKVQWKLWTKDECSGFPVWVIKWSTFTSALLREFD